MEWNVVENSVRTVSATNETAKQMDAVVMTNEKKANSENSWHGRFALHILGFTVRQRETALKRYFTSGFLFLQSISSNLVNLFPVNIELSNYLFHLMQCRRKKLRFAYFAYQASKGPCNDEQLISRFICVKPIEMRNTSATIWKREVLLRLD